MAACRPDVTERAMLEALQSYPPIRDRAGASEPCSQGFMIPLGGALLRRTAERQIFAD